MHHTKGPRPCTVQGGSRAAYRGYRGEVTKNNPADQAGGSGEGRGVTTRRLSPALRPTGASAASGDMGPLVRVDPGGGVQLDLQVRHLLAMTSALFSVNRISSSVDSRLDAVWLIDCSAAIHVVVIIPVASGPARVRPSVGPPPPALLMATSLDRAAHGKTPRPAPERMSRGVATMGGP
jgi:hypothetical protein